jgi:hypothetical protein
MTTYKVSLVTEYTDRADIHMSNPEVMDESELDQYIGNLSRQSRAIMKPSESSFTFYVPADIGEGYKILNIKVVAAVG